MGRILENWRIPSAALISAVLIVVAYGFARGVENPSSAQASEEAALLQAIATRDSDADGLPDWEEALYGTDPKVSDSRHLGMTDGEAVAKGIIIPKAIADISVTTSSSDKSAIVDPSLPPAPADGTLTAVFAKNFFTHYIVAKQNNGGTDLSPSGVQKVADETLNSLAQSITAAPDFKSATDIKVSGTGPEALLAFAIAAEAALKKNATDATMSDLQYLQAYVENNDASALGHLSSLAKAYRNSAAGLAQLSVPIELASVDLAIVNSVMRLSEIYNDFSRIDTDPLAAVYALQQYPQTELNAEHAFTTLANIYAAAGIVLPNGTPGASFVNIMANIGRETP